MNEQIIFFKKTFNLYNEYKSKLFTYEDVTSNIQRDEDLINDKRLLSLIPLIEFVDNPHDIKDVKSSLSLEHDESIDLTRLFHLIKIQETYNKEYKEYIEKGVYFYGCSFNVYKKTYSTRLKEFQKCFIDAEEIDFIKKEFIFDDNEYVVPCEKLPLNFSNNYYTNKELSLKKRNEFLIIKMNKLDYEVVSKEIDVSFDDARSLMATKYYITKKEVSNISVNNMQNINNFNSVKWKGSQTELMELIKALIENGNIKGKQKDISNNFSKFFNIEINNPSKLITDIQKRNNGSETLFIDKLKLALLEYFEKQNSRY